jgi:hypothetical protein
MAGAGRRVQTDPQQKEGVQRFVVGEAWDALNDGDLMHFGDPGQLDRSTAASSNFRRRDEPILPSESDQPAPHGH